MRFQVEAQAKQYRPYRFQVEAQAKQREHMQGFIDKFRANAKRAAMVG